MDERACFLALRLLPGIGPRRLMQLVKRYGSAQAAWNARGEWGQWPGFEKAAATASSGSVARAVARQKRVLASLGARIVTYPDPDYPESLRRIPDPPPLLFVRGLNRPPVARRVAIVGTRRASLYGLRIARQLGRDLGAAGIEVVSGLARGIDGAAHRGALESGGATAAVLGCGLDVAYPPEHRDLMEEIARHGIVLTEYPCGTKPAPGHFPARNRIIAGLADAVVLVEASKRSGAMHTVNLALEAGREVMAVPGDVDRWGSEGPNQLICEGATPVRHARDVLESLGCPADIKGDAASPATGAQEEGDDPAAAVLRLLAASGALSLDELAAGLEQAVEDVAGAVAQLEIGGHVVRQPGGRFVLRR
ncbi:MAG: DNA-protecting protein DprA [Firmicutes bacterium]|nr:DNA-protecting protein DprA [Bacillota bacterium]